jgi:hypothetical protein
MRRLLVILMLSACGPDGFEPGGDLGALRFDPPPSYREMWARAEACSGRRGNFERIRWWVVPGVETFEYGTEQPYADGLWDSDGDITLAGGVLSHPMVVRHEMLHALGFGVDHPAVPFGTPAARPGDRGTRPKRSSSCRLTLPPTLPETSVEISRSASAPP